MMKEFIGKCWNGIQYVVRILLQVIFKWLHRDLSEQVFNSFMQFIKFGIVGISNVLISYFLYVLFLVIFQKFNLCPIIDYSTFPANISK